MSKEIIYDFSSLENYVNGRCTEQEKEEHSERFLWAIQEYESSMGEFTEQDVEYLWGHGLSPLDFTDEELPYYWKN